MFKNGEQPDTDTVYKLETQAAYQIGKTTAKINRIFSTDTKSLDELLIGLIQKDIEKA